MKIDIITLFPKIFSGPFDTSMLKKAQDEKLVGIKIHNLRDWAEDKHKTVDDRPYGGGPGMIIRVDVVDRALKNLKTKELKNTKVILLDAKGKRFTQNIAKRLAKAKHLIFIAGHYEGVDHRVHENLADEVISIGDYILTGGEIPAMVLVDSIVRLIPGVLKPESLLNESFSKIENARLPAGQEKLKMENYTEYPQYTRPENYKGWKVPEVLLSGNHKEIEIWRKGKSLEKQQK